MRIVILGAALSMLGVAAPSAQTPTTAAPPAALVGPPKGLPGYSQPEITAAYCRNVGPNHTTCTFPAMTAGRYIATATGTSTANGQAAQAIVIEVAGRTCRADRKASAQWTTGAKTIAINCEVLVLADKPLTVNAYYADDKATKDPKGPTLVIQRAPWQGLLGLTPIAPQQ